MTTTQQNNATAATPQENAAMNLRHSIRGNGPGIHLFSGIELAISCVLDERSALLRERDELRAALERLLEVYHHSGKYSPLEKMGVVNQARAALARRSFRP